VGTLIVLDFNGGASTALALAVIAGLIASPFLLGLLWRSVDRHREKRGTSRAATMNQATLLELVVLPAWIAVIVVAAVEGEWPVFGILIASWAVACCWWFARATRRV
jgi:hypothetical protein